MTPLAAFGVCILLTLLIVLLFVVVTGGGAIFLLHAIASLVIQEIAKPFVGRVSDRSTGFFVSIVIFILAQILFVSALFFGLYWIIWGHAHASNQYTSFTPTTIDASNLTWLIGLNKILLLTMGYFVCNFAYHKIKALRVHGQTNPQLGFMYFILPLASFFLGFIYLIASLYYLIDYPAKESIGVFPTIAVCLYVPYMLYSLGRTIYFYIRYRAHIFPTHTFMQTLQLIVSVVYDGAFLYFFYQTAAALKLH